MDVSLYSLKNAFSNPDFRARYNDNKGLYTFILVTPSDESAFQELVDSYEEIHWLTGKHIVVIGPSILVNNQPALREDVAKIITSKLRREDFLQFKNNQTRESYDFARFIDISENSLPAIVFFDTLINPTEYAVWKIDPNNFSLITSFRSLATHLNKKCCWRDIDKLQNLEKHETFKLEKLKSKINKAIPVLDAIYDWDSKLITKYSIVDNTGVWSSSIKAANFDIEGKIGLKKLTVETFISYSPKDEDLRKELDDHLSNLKRQGKIFVWYDEAIEPGAERKVEIKKRLESAHLILLLISSGFMASNSCYQEQMQQALERYEAGTAQVIPIILKPVDWENAPFSKLEMLPKNGRAITSWNIRDEAFLDVVEGIQRSVESLRQMFAI